jgi:hypothetical protein
MTTVANLSAIIDLIGELPAVIVAFTAVIVPLVILWAYKAFGKSLTKIFSDFGNMLKL